MSSLEAKKIAPATGTTVTLGAAGDTVGVSATALKTNTIKDASLSITDSEMNLVFDSIPDGEYAISLLHDENENGDMDLNFIGYPLEGFGLANIIGLYLNCTTV